MSGGTKRRLGSGGDGGVVTGSAAAPEPPPTGDGVEILPLVKADLDARAEMGREKHGTTLRAHNGRDGLMDAYQEALDQVMYLRQVLEERKPGAITSMAAVVGRRIVAAHWQTVVAETGQMVTALDALELEDGVLLELDVAEPAPGQGVHGPMVVGEAFLPRPGRPDPVSESTDPQAPDRLDPDHVLPR